MGTKLYLLAFLILLGISILLIAYPMLYQLFSSSSTSFNPSTNVKIIAHRGASKLAPENTLAAISKALSLGVDMIEVDVHLTMDYQLIIIHDESLERTTNGLGNVADYTLKELKTLDAGSWFSNEYEGEQLPTLEEILTLVNGKATCLVEIKWSKNGRYEGIEKKIVRVIQSHKAHKWVIVQSFKSSFLKNIHQQDPNISLGKLLIGSWSFPVPFYFDHQFHWGKFTPPNYVKWVNFYSKRATPTYINHLKSKGVKVGVFTPNSEKDLIRQMNMGVDAVITDNLDVSI